MLAVSRITDATKSHCCFAILFTGRSKGQLTHWNSTQDFDKVCVYHHLWLIMGVEVRVMHVFLYDVKTTHTLHAAFHIWAKNNYSMYNSVFMHNESLCIHFFYLIKGSCYSLGAIAYDAENVHPTV